MTSASSAGAERSIAAAYRRTMGCFASGVTVVTTEAGGEVRGMTANGFISVSMEPPLVLVSLACKTRLHQLLAESGRYVVNVLAEEHEALSWHFAGAPIEHVEPSFSFHDGLPLLDGALAH